MIRRTRKAVCIALVLAMLLSILTIAPLSVTAVSGIEIGQNSVNSTPDEPEASTPDETEPEDDTDRYAPPVGAETYRYYFYMPENWYNEETRNAGIYWWAGTDPCPSWQDMYKMQKGDYENVFYVDLPADVEIVIFTNALSEGDNAKQTVNVYLLYDDNSPRGYSFYDNFIYVIDPDYTVINEFNGALLYEGNWVEYDVWLAENFGVEPSEEPSSSEPSVTEPSETEPSETEPSETEPSVTEPTKPVTRPTEPSTAIPPEDTYITVNAASNLFPSSVAFYDDTTLTVTVTYNLQSDALLLNGDWTLKYDPEVLALDIDSCFNDDDECVVMPVIKDAGAVYNFNYLPGILYANFSRLKGYDFSTESPFVSVTFDVIGSGNTTVYLEIDAMNTLGGSNKNVLLTSTDDSVLIGDINSDGFIDVNDVTYLQMYFAGYDVGIDDLAPEVMDCNGDNVFDISDVHAIQSALRGEGDVDGFTRLAYFVEACPGVDGVAFNTQITRTAAAPEPTEPEPSTPDEPEPVPTEPEPSTPDEPEPVPTEPESHTYTDNLTGISVVTDTDAELVVEEITDIESIDAFAFALDPFEIPLALFDISLEKDGVTVQPDGTVTVKIPTLITDIRVYRVEADGTLTDMNAEYEDGYLVFTTDHFSMYAIVMDISDIVIIGDVNYDGNLDINDVTYIQMYLAGYESYIINEEDKMELAIADFNNDNEIDINDVTSIQMKLAGYNI